jgi:predicted nucleic acid-binding protein
VITAIDTNVLLDIFIGDARFGATSRDALRRCLADGIVVACDVVWSETVAAFTDPQSATNAMDLLGIGFVAIGQTEAAAAGMAWRDYRRAGGTRERVVSDFLIAAHAAGQADRLLTRDRGFYRRYFADLQVIDPSI